MTAVALGAHLSSYGPDEIAPSLITIVLALFPVIFLIFGPVVVVVAAARIPLDKLFTGLPAYVYVVGGASVLYVFVDFFAMMQVLPGQPEQAGSTFYFNDHGTLIPASADAYRIGLMHAARLFSGHELIFFGYSALMAYQIDGIRNGRISIELVPHDDAMESSRLPYPLQRIVSLWTPQTAKECAARLLTPKPRSVWSLFETSRALRGEASAAGFRVELASAQSQLVYAVGRFKGDGGGTSIRLLLTFKKWPLVFLAASAVLIPLAWAAMGFLGFQPPGFTLVFLVVFGVVGNFLFGLDQRRRLLAQIKQATDARDVSRRRGP